MVVATSAAATVLVVSRPRREPQTPTVRLAPMRRVDARISWALADAYRPLQAVRGTGTAEPISLETLAALEKRGEIRPLAAALLLSGDLGRARSLLQKLKTTPDVLADLSACALMERRFDEAVDWAQIAIDSAPHHSRALWNRALAAEQLGFLLVAAEDFRHVAGLGEPGWSGEALQRQRIAQAEWSKIEGIYRAALQAGISLLLEHRLIPDSLVEAAPSLARIHLYFALRTARSATEVRSLLPLAARLDARLGLDARIVQIVEKAARQDFATRRALVPLLTSMIAGYFRGQAAHGIHVDVPASTSSLSDPQKAELQKQLLAHGAPEDWVLALPVLSRLPAELTLYERMAAQTADPWYQFAAQNERASQHLAIGNVAEAERLLRDVITRADRSAPFRAMRARQYLAHAYLQSHRVQEAQVVVVESLAKLRTDLDFTAEGHLLIQLGDAARFRNSLGMSVAALTERAHRLHDDCGSQRYLHESVAQLRLDTLDPARIRTELSAAKACGEPLSVVGVLALADLIRLDPRSEDRHEFAEELAKLRAQSQTPEDEALADHVEGRVLIDQDPLAGETLLRASIARSKALPPTPMVKKIAAYGFGLLRSQAGRERKFERVLTITEQETGAPPEQPCTMVVEVQDDRITVAGRDASGTVSGDFVRVPLIRPHPRWTEVEEISAVAVPVAKKLSQRCGETPLRLYAGFPLNGHGGWLPDDIAWSYASGRTPLPPRSGTHLIVSDVETPADLGLPRLATRSPTSSATMLKGSEATIGRVLKASESASFIEFETHGMMNSGSEDASMLILSPSAEGYALTASKVRTASLGHHPVVILGACHAATVAPFFRERWSLPHAFLDAGARAVIAAPVELPDGEARDFFSGLSARILAGVDPAVALKYERIHWLKSGAGAWVRSVLVFE